MYLGGPWGKAGRREPTEREFQEKLASGNRPSGEPRKSRPTGTDQEESPGKAGRRESTERVSPGKAGRRKPSEREFQGSKKSLESQGSTKNYKIKVISKATGASGQQQNLKVIVTKKLER